MENTKLNLSQPPPELQKRSNNTPSLESILKGKSDQKFVPHAQKEHITPKLIKLVYKPAMSKLSGLPMAPKLPPLVLAPRYQV
jgi:hypothetical protein